MKISIIIPTYNRLPFLKKVLKNINYQLQLEKNNITVIIINDFSSDGTFEYLYNLTPNNFKLLTINGNGNWWWTKCVNEGVKLAIEERSDLILTLNDDLEIKEEYLASIIEVHLNNPDAIIGSVCVDINNPNIIFHAGVRWDFKKYKSYPLYMGSNLKDLPEIYETDSHPGRGTLIPVEVFNKIGLYDQNNFPQYAADDDFSIRAKKGGFRLLMSSKSIVYSHIEKTASGNTHKKTIIQYYKGLFSKRTSYNIIYSTIFVWRHSLHGYKVLNTMKNILIKLLLPFYYKFK